MKHSLIVFILLGFSLTALAQKNDSSKRPKALKVAELADAYFEMRTYHCNENKRPDLIRRFQDHTLHLLERHGNTNVGSAHNEQLEPAHRLLLIYILRHLKPPGLTQTAI